MTDEVRKPKQIGELFEAFKNPAKDTKRRTTNRPEQATVDEIQKVLGFTKDTKPYGYSYWLKLCKWAKLDFHEIFGILKEIENADPKYNKGGMLTNKLLKLKKARQFLKKE